MIIANNATHKLFISDYTKQNSRLQTSMSKLSSGQRMIAPGEAPADLGISERFRRQIKSSEEANRVIQNGMNFFQTADSWLQEIHNILGRMSELSTSAADGSKSQEDRKNLDIEFQQLKQEVARIGESGRYNGLQLNSKNSVAVYNQRKNTIVFSQPDGTNSQDLGINLSDGNTAANGIAYSFESATDGVVGDFIFTKDGKSLIYIAQKDATNVSARKTIQKLDLRSNTIRSVNLTAEGGQSAYTQNRLNIDEQGRIWASNASGAAASAGNGVYQIVLINHDSMLVDSGGAASSNNWIGMSSDVRLASGFSNFGVSNDYLYYFSRESKSTGPLRYVKQNIHDRNDMQVLLNDVSGNAFDLDKGENYSISKDGQYIAFNNLNNTGELRIINTNSAEIMHMNVGNAATSIVSLDFDENNTLYWTSTGGATDENVMRRAKIRAGDTPEIYDLETVMQTKSQELGAADAATAGMGMGMKTQIGSPAHVFKFQVGPDNGQVVDFESGDVSLIKLGISRLRIDKQEYTTEAIKNLTKAVDSVALQRAKIGAQVSRLGFIYSANDSYKNNLAATESRIRDVDFAKESSEMAQAQILAQGAISVIAQANQSRSNILALLQ